CFIVREISMTTMTCKEIGDFLTEYATWLWGCGATCIRMEKNVRRMAKALDVEMDMSIMPSHVYATVWSRDRSNSYTMVRRMHKSVISFDINTQLSKLSWDLADGRCDFVQAKKKFEYIKDTPTANPWLVLLLASVANASFCRLFGGDVVAMLLVFAATLCGMRVKQIMIADKVDVRFVFVCSSFFSAVIATGGHLFSWGSTPEIALASSVLYLIPGIPYINSVNDMLDGHYICAYSRLMDGIMLTACLSLGLCCGLVVMNMKII
ncbi:MAG: threonine/serine exporter ThrE family protein, partial [Prevotella sp.]